MGLINRFKRGAGQLMGDTADVIGGIATDLAAPFRGGQDAKSPGSFELGLSERWRNWGADTAQAAENVSPIQEFVGSNGNIWTRYSDGSTSDTGQKGGATLPGSSNVFNRTGGNTSATQITPNNANIGDRIYDLNNPNELQQYISDMDNKLNSDFDYFSQRAKQTSEEEIYEAEQEQQRALTQIERALTRLGESKEQYGQQFTQSIADLAEGFRQGTAKRQSFYASIAPRVYQSSQGTSQDYAKGKFDEGNKRYEQQKAQAMTEFGRAEQEYAENRDLTTNQFNLYKTRRQRQYEDEIADKARQVEDMKGQARANTLNYSDSLRQAGVQSNKFALQNSFQEKDFSQYQPSKVNLNDLMQFIKFQPAGATGAPMQAQGTTQAIATPEAGGQALAQHLGYQATPEEPSTLNAYKKGQGLY